MNDIMVNKEMLEKTIDMVAKHGKPAVVLILGLYGLDIAREVALKAIENKASISVGGFGFSLSVNNTTVNAAS